MREIWFLHVDNKVAAYIPNKKCPTYSFAEQGEFKNFVNSFKQNEHFKDYKFKNVRDHEIEKFLRSRLKMQQMILLSRGGRYE